MKTSVYSEIGRLKKVMVHAPGKGIDAIVPSKANELLFEDILFGDLARYEHDLMCKVFQKYGVEVFKIHDLLIQSLESAGKVFVDNLINEIINISKFSSKAQSALKALSNFSDLASALIDGVLYPSSEQDESNLYLIPPIPNLLFARDPIIMCHDKILISAMAEEVRNRESYLMQFIFTHHPVLKNPEQMISLAKKFPNQKNLTIEGGDFLVIDEKTVAIGWSIRTTLESIKQIGKELSQIGVENLVVAKLPPETAFIHLDTTFTRISHDECLFFPPLYAKDSKSKVEILYFDLTKKELTEQKYDYIIDLFNDLGIRLNPIYCGGKESYVSQVREQWTQGANSVCIAPGIILTYGRNIKTAGELAKAGYLCISAEEVIKPTFVPNFNQKTVIMIKGEELCRARGGPRCLTHPLERESVN